MLNCIEREEKQLTLSYHSYIVITVYKRIQRPSFPFLFTMVYIEASRKYALSKHFSNKSFLQRLGHTKESIRGFEIRTGTKP